MSWYKIAKLSEKPYKIYLYGEGEGKFIGYVYAVSQNQAKVKANRHIFDSIEVDARQLDNMMTRGYKFQAYLDKERYAQEKTKKEEMFEQQELWQKYDKEKEQTAIDKWQNMYD